MLSSCSLVFKKSSAKKLFDDDDDDDEGFGGISKIVERIVQSDAEDSNKVIPNALVSINTGQYACHRNTFIDRFFLHWIRIIE